MACNPQKRYRIICSKEKPGGIEGFLKLLSFGSSAAPVAEMDISSFKSLPQVAKFHFSKFKQWLTEVMCASTPETIMQLREWGVEPVVKQKKLIEFTATECQLTDMYYHWLQSSNPRGLDIPESIPADQIFVSGVDFGKLGPQLQNQVLYLLWREPEELAQICAEDETMNNICQNIEIVSGVGGTFYKLSGIDQWRRFLPIYNKISRPHAGLLALPEAIKSGDEEIVGVVLAADKRLNVKVEDTTPLHYAINQGNEKIVEQLLFAGADVNETDEFGTTPLQNAMNQGNPYIIDVLQQAGAIE